MKNLKRIIQAGLLVGTLDILAAFIQFFLATNKEPSPVLKFIASGVFGPEAFRGGMEMIVAGLILHYIIALGFTFLLFMIYPMLPGAIKNNFLLGICYGIFIWCVMKFAVVPLSNTPPQSFSLSGAAIAISILIVCIGIPLAVIARRSLGTK